MTWACASSPWTISRRWAARKSFANAAASAAPGPTYITFDIDGLDPVYCIGTGVPEPGGLSMRDAQVIIRGLQGLNLIGGDVCEVLPLADPSGHTALERRQPDVRDALRDRRLPREPLGAVEIRHS